MLSLLCRTLSAFNHDVSVVEKFVLKVVPDVQAAWKALEPSERSLKLINSSHDINLAALKAHGQPATSSVCIATMIMLTFLILCWQQCDLLSTARCMSRRCISVLHTCAACLGAETCIEWR